MFNLDENDPMVRKVMEQQHAEAMQQAAITGMVRQLALIVYAQLAMARKSQEGKLGKIELNDGRRLAANAIGLAEEYAPFFLEQINFIPSLEEEDEVPPEEDGDSSPIMTTGE